MLFKLFTLFSMVVLTQGASVRETGPSYVTRRHHHYGGGVGGGGWGGSDSGGCGGWQDLLSGQTVTVTVTETPVYSTSTDEPIVTDDTVSTTDGGDDSTDLNSQEHCLFLFNEFRKSVNLPPFESATQEQIDCADKAAAYDAQAGYHASFYASMCSGAASQCECMKNTGFDLPTADPNDPLKTCLNAYIAEETLGAYPQLNKGHYRVITSTNFKYLACGTNGDGFYTHNFYN